MNQRARIIADSDNHSIQDGLYLIRAYIFDRTGEKVNVTDPNPIDKFEKAVTITSEWYNSQKSARTYTFNW